MNRAFVTEQDGWNYCSSRARYCIDADLRGECERGRCRYGEPEKKENEKEEKNSR